MSLPPDGIYDERNTTGAYYCGVCGVWVNWGEHHVCSGTVITDNKTYKTCPHCGKVIVGEQ